MLYQDILHKSKEGLKQLAVLVDPDKCNATHLEDIARKAQNNADYIFVGGSLLSKNNLIECVRTLKKNTSTPIILFPGNELQITSEANAILLLSLISGRNPEMLIGKHVVSAPYLKESKMEIIPTGYILVESGKTTSVLYMSQTFPIPHDKKDIALCTAMAGEMLGLKLIYLEAGSGALNTTSTEMISHVKAGINIPLIVGGGIRTAEKAKEICNAGADIIVIGNAFEKSPDLITEIFHSIKIKN